MSSVSTALALVLDGIAMSAKTSTSLKKALSYRAVEILLVANHGSDGHRLPEAIHEVLQTNRNPVLDEQSNVILVGTARADRQQVADVVHDEKIPVHEKQDDYNARQELKSKHDKEFKFKKAIAKTQETIKTAKLKIEHVKIEEHEMQETELITKQNLLDEFSQSKSCSAEDFQEVMDKLAGKENECEQMKKMYKELADTADECEQMKKRWEEIAK